MKNAKIFFNIHHVIFIPILFFKLIILSMLIFSWLSLWLIYTFLSCSIKGKHYFPFSNMYHIDINDFLSIYFTHPLLSFILTTMISPLYHRSSFISHFTLKFKISHLSISCSVNNKEWLSYYGYNNTGCGRCNKYAKINFLLCRSKAKFSVALAQKIFYQGQIDFHVLYSVLEAFSVHWMCMCSFQFSDLLLSGIWNQILPMNGNGVFSRPTLMHHSPAHPSPVAVICIPCPPDNMMLRYPRPKSPSHQLQGSHNLEPPSPGQTLTEDI